MEHLLLFIVEIAIPLIGAMVGAYITVARYTKERRKEAVERAAQLQDLQHAVKRNAENFEKHEKVCKEQNESINTALQNLTTTVNKVDSRLSNIEGRLEGLR